MMPRPRIRVADYPFWLRIKTAPGTISLSALVPRPRLTPAADERWMKTTLVPQDNLHATAD